MVDKRFHLVGLWVINLVFLKMGHPGLFFFYFCLFKQAVQFLQQINVKIIIQYTLLGFEPTTTRPGLPPIILVF